ncbi:hypothetical protein GC194_14625 [bacterium]|nr:hypothetical protein [bacterium]
MKTIVVAIVLLVSAFAASAQQRYLLEPVDSPGTVVINEDPILKRISLQKIKVNKINRFDGYRVEIYQGNNREEAKTALEEFKELYPDVPAEIVYEGPYAKVKVGIYRSKLEAQKMLVTMQETHPGSKIVYVRGMPFPPLLVHDKQDTAEEVDDEY